MEQEKVPVVFISYCWTNKEHMQWVLELATRLVAESGVEVILDRWHGIVGHDRFQFMEESIRKADKVLVICDEMYCQKADQRLGGVGTETLIITPDVYNNTKQEKFIPIALHKGPDGSYLLPTYFNSRFIHVMDDPNEFERDYNRLVRMIWEEPELKPPVRGPKPNFQLQEVAVESHKEVLILETNTDEERIVWLLPRGFLLYEKITYDPNILWRSTVTHITYDGKLGYGTFYNESLRDTWDRSLEMQFRKLRIPKADWDWCYEPLQFLQELREVDGPIHIKDQVSHLKYPVYYYAPGEEVPLPKPAEEYRFFQETGDLRDLMEEIRALYKVRLEDEDYHNRSVSIRQQAYVFSLKLLGQNNPLLSFIQEIIAEYDRSFDGLEITLWLKKLDSILSSTLNIIRDEWQIKMK